MQYRDFGKTGLKVSALGFGEEHLRLPLTPMEDATRTKLYAEMRKLGINV
mgnify:CR=1 FL=1